MYFFEFSFSTKSMSYEKMENYFTFSLYLLSPRHSGGYIGKAPARRHSCAWHRNPYRSPIVTFNLSKEERNGSPEPRFTRPEDDASSGSRSTPLCHFVTSPPQGGRLQASIIAPAIENI